jgi:hypothetical protein
MKKLNILAVAAGLLVLSAPAAVFADESTDNKPAAKVSAEDREKLRNMTPDERREWMKKNHPEFAKRMEERSNFFEKNKEVFERAGLKIDEVKDLPPAERRAKLKEAVDKRVADLEKKKSDGTALTEQEQSDFDTLNKVKTYTDRQTTQGAPHRNPKAKKPASDDTK